MILIRMKGFGEYVPFNRFKKEYEEMNFLFYRKLFF